MKSYQSRAVKKIQMFQYEERPFWVTTTGKEVLRRRSRGTVAKQTHAVEGRFRGARQYCRTGRGRTKKLDLKKSMPGNGKRRLMQPRVGSI